MIGRWGLYGDLMRELREAGLSPDIADKAARIAERAVRDRRDEIIRAGHASGVSIRKLGRIWSLAVGPVHRILFPDGRRKGTPP